MYLRSRNDFGHFLNKRGLVGYAVEVGTHRGEFARILLVHWRGKHLYCVDPYIPNYSESDPAAMGNREADWKQALVNLSQFIVKADHPKFSQLNRASFIFETSEKAVQRFADESLDFVYIDGNHEPPNPYNDLKVWWPKVRRNGILAGHDYHCPGEVNGGWGQYVKPSVKKFSREIGLPFSITQDNDGQPYSFYFIKL